jgi:hypothetical protein
LKPALPEPSPADALDGEASSKRATTRTSPSRAAPAASRSKMASTAAGNGA